MTREQLGSFLLVVDPRWGCSSSYSPRRACACRRPLRCAGATWRSMVSAPPSGTAEPAFEASTAHRRAVTASETSRSRSKLVKALRERRTASEWHEDDDLVFPSLAGTPIAPENLHRRTMKPAAQEAGVGWAAYHSFRHACASMLIAEGRNIVQVSRWLGHHSPRFTLDVYAHLMDDGVGSALELGPLPGSGTGKGTLDAVRQANTPRNG